MEQNYQSYSEQIDIWGGPECTINRVGNEYRDQLEETGHYVRKADMDAIAALGIRKMRYPVLWEKHQPDENAKPNFTWISKQLQLIAEKGIIPIAGLLHHGSGPRYTNLLDPEFPYKLAAYAKEVAVAFPWLEYYTPVNEPLTTARFSGLYGTWYPHTRDSRSFMQMLLNEIKATILAMQAIRQINPQAKLVQTEDITKIQSCAALSYQAAFENNRRWLTFDLLCGRMNKDHPLYSYLLNLGIKQEELDFFPDNFCSPDIIGCNYYVTSERYLDDQLDLYPACCHGSNGKHMYADVESVRVQKMKGLSHLLQEVWSRYGLPLAVTEVHLHCTREEQMRWLMEVWEICNRLKQSGVNIQAITAWALLGNYDWNSLLTQKNGHYESGAFDLRNGRLRKTAIAHVIQSLANTGNYTHPVLDQKGWWHNEVKAAGNKPLKRERGILIIGKTGTLGHAFSTICDQRSLKYSLLSRKELDICNEQNIREIIDAYKPWAIINTAGFVRIDDAETAPDECFKINTQGAGLLAKYCKRSSIRFMTFSSDMVFNGGKQLPYTENDEVNPVNVYGYSKAAAERIVLQENPDAFVIRTSSFFGPWDRYNFAYDVLQQLARNETPRAVKDVFISPTYLPDLVHASLDFFIDEEKGIWHITNDGCASWFDIAGEIAQGAGYNKRSVKSVLLDELNPVAKRPLFSAMQSDKGIRLPALDNAIERYLAERKA